MPRKIPNLITGRRAVLPGLFGDDPTTDEPEADMTVTPADPGPSPTVPAQTTITFGEPLEVVQVPWPPSTNALHSPTLHEASFQKAAHLLQTEGLDIAMRFLRSKMFVRPSGQYIKFMNGAHTLIATRRRGARPWKGWLAAGLRVYAPNRQYGPTGRYFYDIDNRVKAAYDALQHAGVIENDKQIRFQFVQDMGVRSPGSITVSLWRYDYDG